MAVEKRNVSRKYYKKLMNYKHLNNQHDNFQKTGWTWNSKEGVIHFFTRKRCEQNMKATEDDKYDKF